MQHRQSPAPFWLIQRVGSDFLRVLKIVHIVLLVLAVVAGAAALYVDRSRIPRYTPGNEEFAVDVTPKRVERGRTTVQTTRHFDSRLKRWMQILGRKWPGCGNIAGTPSAYGPVA